MINNRVGTPAWTRIIPRSGQAVNDFFCQRFQRLGSDLGTVPGCETPSRSGGSALLLI